LENSTRSPKRSFRCSSLPQTYAGHVLVDVLDLDLDATVTGVLLALFALGQLDHPPLGRHS
jgi:hypothetical protein